MPSPDSTRPDYGEYIHHGLRVAFILLAFLGIGWWVDVRLGSSPVCTILGVFLGAAAGFYSLYLHLFGGPKSPGSSHQ